MKTAVASDDDEPQWATHKFDWTKPVIGITGTAGVTTTTLQNWALSWTTSTTWRPVFTPHDPPLDTSP